MAMEGEGQTSMLAEGKIGAVMVVGAGISGIQASLDLANSGFKVYLVDEAPAIGGRMAQLDKTFPTNDCSMCILSPKLIECDRNLNISLMTYTKVIKVEGEAGKFKVTLLKKPRYVEDTCNGCGICVEYCPVKILDAYNEGLSLTRCIYTPFPQAVPQVFVIDPEQCLFLRKRECKICYPVCPLKAINFHQQEEEVVIEVGSIILALGYKPFNPRTQPEYGYGTMSNVVTGLEFERILSASGPYRGEVKRPSDRKPPKRVAWIQCVGSRDTTVNHGYCSAVCCMYAIKQVILSKEHDPELEATIFHNDIRAFGKGFERYYQRAQDLPGVRFIWSKVSVMKEMPGTRNVVIRYCANGNETRDEEFDLVVLSVGLTPSPSAKELAEKLSIKVNHYEFCQGQELAPVETSRPGVYVCGVFHAPMDIPDSVTMASGAAALSAELLSKQRGTLTVEKKYPPERDVSSEPPRIGVFVCRCGTNIARVVDVPRLVRYAKNLDNVVHVEENIFSCSVDSAKHIVETIQEKGLNRVVVAACTPRTHEPLFQDTLKEAGLNPYLFEFANIREHCSWVHMRDRASANRKAQDLVRMAVAKAELLKPLYLLPLGLNHAGLVIGGGVAGMEVALSLAKQGFEVHLLEKTAELGGIARRIHYNLNGEDIQAYLGDLIARVYENPLIHVYTETNILEASGYVGNFTTKIVVGSDEAVKEIAHGITIIASGAVEYKPQEYLYGQDQRVWTLLELEGEIAKDNEKIASAQTAVIILCVGSRDEERPYCSRVCCNQSIRNALKLKEINPKMDIYVLYRDMRTYALAEDYYREAADNGVKFIRYEANNKPEVEAVEEGGRSILRVTVLDLVLGQRLMINADLVALAVATVAQPDNEKLSRLFKIPLNEDGFFLEAHMKLRPVDFATDGIFMCGLAHSPKSLDESIAQAKAAASRAATILAKDTILAGGAVCSVNEDICSGCGICEALCPYGAIIVDGEEKVAKVNEALCKGCGVCCAACPSGAAEQRGFTTDQLLHTMGAALKA